MSLVPGGCGSCGKKKIVASGGYRQKLVRGERSLTTTENSTESSTSGDKRPAYTVVLENGTQEGFDSYVKANRYKRRHNGRLVVNV